MQDLFDEPFTNQDLFEDTFTPQNTFGTPFPDQELFNESSFPDQVQSNILPTEYDNLKEYTMTLYTYIDNQTAHNLFRYFIGLHYNHTKEYVAKKPISVPLTLYESSAIAKEIIKPSLNLQLVAFDIIMQNVYNQLDITQQLHKTTTDLGKLKNSAYIWREIAKLGRCQYVKYTIRNKEAVKSITILDNI